MPFESTDRLALGRTGLRVTRLGFGAPSIGGLFSAVSDDDADRHRRSRLGPRHPDVRHGSALRLRRGGAAARVRRSPAARATSTSCRPRSAGSSARRRDRRPAPTSIGRRSTAARTRSTPEPSPSASSSTTAADGVRRSIEESLERLGLDRIDIALIHDPDDHWRAGDRRGLAGPGPAARRGRDPGGGRRDEPVGDARPVRPRDATSTSFLRRRALHAAGPGGARPSSSRSASTAASGVLVGGVMNSGVLADPRPGQRFNYQPAPPGGHRRAPAGSAAVCERHDVPLRAAAIQFPLAHPAVASLDRRRPPDRPPRRVPGPDAPPDPGRPLGRPSSGGPDPAEAPVPGLTGGDRRRPPPLLGPGAGRLPVADRRACLDPAAVRARRPRAALASRRRRRHGPRADPLEPRRDAGVPRDGRGRRRSSAASSAGST